MFIDLIQCDHCGHRGRPGTDFGASGSPCNELHCKCGHTFAIADGRDQCALSTHIFLRLEALSNQTEHGAVTLLPGHTATVTFSRPFDYVCRAFLTPHSQIPVIAQEAHLQNTGMIILAGLLDPSTPINEKAEVAWLVHGLRDLDSLPPWRVHFFAAVTHLANGLYKPALLDYSAAFELFLETYLREKLVRSFGEGCADHLLRKSWRIEDRCKDLLELATGHKLTERTDVYQPWDTSVRKVRNELAHGASVPVDQAAAERAHQATYQAIRWIECL